MPCVGHNARLDGKSFFAAHRFSREFSASEKLAKRISKLRVFERNRSPACLAELSFWCEDESQPHLEQCSEYLLPSLLCLTVQLTIEKREQVPIDWRGNRWSESTELRDPRQSFRQQCKPWDCVERRERLDGRCSPSRVRACRKRGIPNYSRYSYTTDETRSEKGEKTLCIWVY